MGPFVELDDIAELQVGTPEAVVEDLGDGGGRLKEGFPVEKEVPLHMRL